MATDPDAPALLMLDRSDGGATTRLYRAALGPLHTDYYLRAFTRFDAAGKTGPDWNWSAALLGPNWLMLRQLGSHALAYVGALTAALLLFFGIGRLVFALSDASQWALMAAAVLLAMALTGALGNAWLYAACNQRIEAALAATASIDDACKQLALKASGRKHQVGLAVGNLAMVLVVGATLVVWQRSAVMGPSAGQTPQPPGATTPTEPSGLAAQSVAALAAAAPVASAPVAASLPAAAMQAAAPEPAASLATRSRQGPVEAPALLPLAPAPAPAPAQASAPASSGDYLINVGLFADADNARNAYSKLRVAGLPAYRQVIKTPKGSKRTRVRVGPFASHDAAEQAAKAIRQLKLDAVVAKSD